MPGRLRDAGRRDDDYAFVCGHAVVVLKPCPCPAARGANVLRDKRDGLHVGRFVRTES
jgi:hypothetical protein